MDKKPNKITKEYLNYTHNQWKLCLRVGSNKSYRNDNAQDVSLKLSTVRILHFRYNSDDTRSFGSFEAALIKFLFPETMWNLVHIYCTYAWKAMQINA